jgi:hypothetical protein
VGVASGGHPRAGAPLFSPPWSRPGQPSPSGAGGAALALPVRLARFPARAEHSAGPAGAEQGENPPSSELISLKRRGGSGRPARKKGRRRRESEGRRSGGRSRAGPSRAGGGRQEAGREEVGPRGEPAGGRRAPGAPPLRLRCSASLSSAPASGRDRRRRPPACPAWPARRCRCCCGCCCCCCCCSRAPAGRWTWPITPTTWARRMPLSPSTTKTPARRVSVPQSPRRAGPGARRGLGIGFGVGGGQSSVGSPELPGWQCSGEQKNEGEREGGSLGDFRTEVLLPFVEAAAGLCLLPSQRIPGEISLGPREFRG